ncbi:MAG: hypothetical protein QOH76_3974 [Thermoleophilaceae bacterium]|nr:hypothetical protein [Thermoleophilaceae bacterium]
MKIAAAVAALLALSLLGSSAASAATPSPLNQYVVTHVSQKALTDGGFDRTEAGLPGHPGTYLVVATPSQANALRGRGATVRSLHGVSRSRRAAPRARAKTLVNPTHGYNVFRPWSLTPAPCPGTCSTPNISLKSWYHGIAAQNTRIVKETVIGRSVLGQPIIAYKMTDNARRLRDGSRPAVLYDSTQHAREWIATEVERRLFNYLVTHKNDSAIARILRTRELWFVPVVNPDGYDYTFESPATRLWRKNLHDNNGDGQIADGDGVDTNRNFPYKWNWDLEGSSDEPPDETFHGTAGASEPEVKAIRALQARVHPSFSLDYHSFAKLILYPEGWQVETPATDAPLFRALAGNSDNPAVPTYDPEVAAQLYTTNGDITDDAYHNYKVGAYTVELDGGEGAGVGGTDGSDPNLTPGGFVFQDDEAAVQAVFEKNLPFALDLARSATRPDRPDSHLGNTAPDLVPTTFPTSNGTPQLVEVNAKRSAGRVTAHWRINGRRERRSSMFEFSGGQRYGEPGIYYHRLRASIYGMRPGDQVSVWFTANGRRHHRHDRHRGRNRHRGGHGGRVATQPFSYTVKSDTRAPVLLMVAEDYTGRSSLQSPTPYGTAPLYRTDYEDALRAAGIRFDTYDVDANGRTAATHLGVLSHYRAVIWETGDDVIVRGPDQQRPGGPESGGGTGTEKLFDDEVINARDFMNEGGKLLVTGQFAIEGAWENQTYNPLGATPPRPFCPSSSSLGSGFENSPPGQATPCNFVADDFQQYWLGAYTTLDGGDPAAAQLQELAPLGSSIFGLNGADSAQNQANLYRFLTTSDVLPPATYPQFQSNVAMKVQGPPAYDPPTGSWYAYSQTGNSTYKRLQTTVDLRGKASGALTFKLSYLTEPGYDFVFVEAHTVGQEDWTTLPDQNGATSDDTGPGCNDADPFWLNENPFLTHYITRTPDPSSDTGFTCTPTGSSGSWNAATGNSSGFTDWNVDLTPFAGKQVELSITYASDPGVQLLGTFLDDVKVTSGAQTLLSTSFEDGTLAPFQVGTPPAGSKQIVFKNWIASKSKGFEDGPGVRTSRSLILGFGAEGVNGAANRAKLLKDGLRMLGVP